MKSVRLDTKCPEEIHFPKLMIHKRTESVFLMVTPVRGTRVYTPSVVASRPLGQVMPSLDVHLLSDYVGSICLEN